MQFQYLNTTTAMNVSARRDGTTRKQLFDAGIKALQDAINNQSIPNPTYIDAKDDIIRAFEKAADEVSRLILDNRDNDPVFDSYEREILDAAYYGGDSPINWASKLKKIKKLPAEVRELPVMQIAIKLGEDATKVAALIKDAKAFVVKRQPKSEEEKAAIKPKYAPNLSKSAIEEVVKILTGIVEDHKDVLRESLNKEFDGVVESYRNMLASLIDGKDRKDVMRYAPQSFFGAKGLGYFDSYGKKFAEEEFVAQKAKLVEAAYKSITGGFVRKNAAKLAAVLDRKRGVAMTYTIGTIVAIRYLQGHIRFNFEDGSGFTVMNSSVYAVSMHGVSFMRYPLTFHDVVNSDGTKMGRPSEERMNKVWY